MRSATKLPIARSSHGRLPAYRELRSLTLFQCGAAWLRSCRDMYSPDGGTSYSQCHAWKTVIGNRRSRASSAGHRSAAALSGVPASAQAGDPYGHRDHELDLRVEQVRVSRVTLAPRLAPRAFARSEKGFRKTPKPFLTCRNGSGWRDLNPRPLRPERSALPSCATPRCRRAEETYLPSTPRRV